MARVAWAALLATACGGGTASGVDAGSDAPPGSADGAIADAGGRAIGDCSHFPSIAAHADFLNQTRRDYEPHERWRGIPWQGESHSTVTFPIAFALTPGLAADAQIEAQRIAGGGEPAGVQVPGQNGENRDLWIDGLSTAAWRITAIEYPGDWNVPMWGHEAAALHPSNGSARMAFFYHDFGGVGPSISQMGVGGIATQDCRVVWVLQMAP